MRLFYILIILNFEIINPVDSSIKLCEYLRLIGKTIPECQEEDGNMPVATDEGIICLLTIKNYGVLNFQLK